MSYRQVSELFADEPMMAALFAYWEERRRGRKMPDRADVDPTDIDRSVLPYMTLYDVVDGGRRARARVIGSAIVPNLDIPDPTGRFIDEVLPPAQAAYFASTMIDVVDHQCPIYSVDWHTSLKRQHFLAKRLILPLTRGGSAVAQTMGLTRHATCTEEDIRHAFPTGEDWSDRLPERSELVRYRIRDGMVEPAATR